MTHGGDGRNNGSCRPSRILPALIDFIFTALTVTSGRMFTFRRGRVVCKFWLDPVALAQNHGFAARELNEIRAIIREERTKIEGAWREHCGER